MKRKKHKRVVRLSVVDKARLAAGEYADELAVLHQYDATNIRVSQLSVGRDTSVTEDNLSARDAEILREVPPHYGKF